MSAAPFEELRKYLTQAVDQLLQEMAAQQIAYAVPSDDVVQLLRRVALVQDRTVWQEWESWALRHAIPVHDFIKRGPLTEAEQRVIHKRLMDLLGYCVLGLVMSEPSS